MKRLSKQKLEVIRERAFSKVIWGERDIEVIRFLRSERIDNEAALSILREAHQARATAIRKRSVVKVVVSGLIALLSGFIVVFMTIYSDLNVSSLGICFYTICIFTCLWCMIFAVKALIELTSGKTRGSALMD